MTLKKSHLVDKYSTLLAPLGLTANDTRVYVALLERGISIGGSKLATMLDMHRQYVYNSLQKLSAMGLITVHVEKKLARYQALPPTQITKRARQELDTAEAIEQELKQISAIGAEQDFEVYAGDREVRAYETSLVNRFPAHTAQYIIGGNSDHFMEQFGDMYSDLTSTLNEKGFQTYYIACKEEVRWVETAHRAHRAFAYRVLPTMPHTVMSTAIRLDTVTLYSMAKPPLIYVIKSKRVADDYKKYFDMLWAMAGKGI